MWVQTAAWQWCNLERLLTIEAVPRYRVRRTQTLPPNSPRPSQPSSRPTNVSTRPATTETIETHYGELAAGQRGALCGHSLIGRIEGERLQAVAHAYKPIILYDGADEEEAAFALLSLHYGVALAIPGCPHFLASVDRNGVKMTPRDVGITQFAWRRSALIRAYQMPEDAEPAPHVPKLWKNLRLVAWGIRERVLDMSDLPRNIAEQVNLILHAQAREDQEALPESGPAEFRFLDIRS